jgi:hypothetical protein
MEPLITRIDKAVQAHTDRIEALNRALYWLPKKDVHGPNISAGAGRAILANRLGPKKTAISEGSQRLLGEHIAMNGPYPEDPGDEVMVLCATHSAAAERFQLSNATTFVGSEIVDLISIAANDLPFEPLRRTDVYEPSGFIYLEKPLVVEIDESYYSDGTPGKVESIGIRGIAWNADEMGVMQKRHQKPLGLSPVSTVARIGTGTPSVLDEVSKRDDIGGIRITVYTDLGCVRYITGWGDQWPDVTPDRTLLINQLTAWAYNAPWRVADIASGEDCHVDLDDNETLVTSPDLAVVRKFILSLWRFMWQELVVRETGEVPSHIRKGMVRALDRKDPITVLKLRRHKTSSDGDGEGSGSRLDYRLLVRGHWRNQWYRSLGPVEDPASHRMIWIDPHVRGPEDAPFRTKPKVLAVVR